MYEKFGTMARLMDRRWSGHYETTQSLVKNFAEVRTTLEYFISSEASDAEISIKAAGLLAATSKRQFIFANEVMSLILNLLAPADKILQQQPSSLVACYDAINSTVTVIRKLRNDAEFEKILQKLKLPLKLFHPTNKRKKSVSCRFREDVITEDIGIHNESESLNLKASYFEIIDIIQSEFSHRLSEFYASHQIFACLLHRHRIAFSTRKNYNLSVF